MNLINERRFSIRSESKKEYIEESSPIFDFENLPRKEFIVERSTGKRRKTSSYNVTQFDDIPKRNDSKNKMMIDFTKIGETTKDQILKFENNTILNFLQEKLKQLEKEEPVNPKKMLFLQTEKRSQLDVRLNSYRQEFNKNNKGINNTTTFKKNQIVNLDIQKPIDKHVTTEFIKNKRYSHNLPISKIAQIIHSPTTQKLNEILNSPLSINRHNSNLVLDNYNVLLDNNNNLNKSNSVNENRLISNLNKPEIKLIESNNLIENCSSDCKIQSKGSISVNDRKGSFFDAGSNNELLILNENKLLQENELPIPEIIKKEGKKDPFVEKTQRLVMDNKEQYRKLNHTLLVYDSLSDEEKDEIEMNFYIAPDSAFKNMWENIILLTTIYSVVMVPFELGFITITSLLFTVELIIDIIYILDIVLNFFYAFQNFDEILIINMKEISIKYLKSWFLLDVFCAIPTNSVFNYLIISKTINSINSIKFDAGRIYFILRILRLIKFYKAIKCNKFNFHNIRCLDEMNISSGMSRLIRYAFYLLLFIHALSCIWRFLGTVGIPNWIVGNKMENSDEIELYVASFYFLSSSIFTIGYGDIISHNIYERIFTIFLLLFGVFVYSFAVSSLSNILITSDDKTQTFSDNMDLLTKYRLKYNISNKLFVKIARFLKYDLVLNKKDKNKFLNTLPVYLRNEMLTKMYKEIIDNFVFFRNIHNYDFVMRVVSSFRPIWGSRNEIIVQQGDLCNEILFVKRGALVLEVEFILYKYENGKSILRTVPTWRRFDSSTCNTIKSVRKKFPRKFGSNQLSEYEIVRAKIIEIRKNEHFGDVLMFWNKRSPLTVKVKSKMAEFFIIRKYDLIKISADFPDILQKILIKSSFNLEQIKNKISKIKKNIYEKYKYTLQGGLQTIEGLNINDNFNVVDNFNHSNSIKVFEINKSSEIDISKESERMSENENYDKKQENRNILNQECDKNIIYEEQSDNESEKSKNNTRSVQSKIGDSILPLRKISNKSSFMQQFDRVSNSKLTFKKLDFPQSVKSSTSDLVSKMKSTNMVISSKMLPSEGEIITKLNADQNNGTNTNFSIMYNVNISNSFNINAEHKYENRDDHQMKRNDRQTNRKKSVELLDNLQNNLLQPDIITSTFKEKINQENLIFEKKEEKNCHDSKKYEKSKSKKYITQHEYMNNFDISDVSNDSSLLSNLINNKEYKVAIINNVDWSCLQASKINSFIIESLYPNKLLENSNGKHNPEFFEKISKIKSLKNRSFSSLIKNRSTSRYYNNEKYLSTTKMNLSSQDSNLSIIENPKSLNNSFYLKLPTYHDSIDEGKRRIHSISVNHSPVNSNLFPYKQTRNSFGNFLNVTKPLHNHKSKSLNKNLDHKSFYREISQNYKISSFNINEPQSYYSEMFNVHIIKMEEHAMKKLNNLYKVISKHYKTK